MGGARGPRRKNRQFCAYYGVREARDLTRVLDAVEERGWRVGQVGVAGYSYGAAVSIQWAGLDARVRAVIAIAPFSTLQDIGGAPPWQIVYIMHLMRNLSVGPK